MGQGGEIILVVGWPKLGAQDRWYGGGMSKMFERWHGKMYWGLKGDQNNVGGPKIFFV